MIEQRGFSMVEMAMVLVIFSLLMGGMLMPMAAQYRNKRVAETQGKLNAIVETLYGFALGRGRLPCPDIDGDGQEDRSASGRCRRASGDLPWVTLSVDAGDAWGRPWIYRVTGAFADAADGTGCGKTVAGVSFSLCSQGDIQVKDSAGGLVADKLPAIVVSQGENPSASRVERENWDGDRVFVKDVYSDVPGKEFDDQVAWVTSAALKNRMVVAGVLSVPESGSEEGEGDDD